MSNYNSTLQSNNTDLQAILNTINELPEATEQATPVISVNASGLITATAGTKSSTHQLAFQAAKTITPSTVNQIAVSSGYYTGGSVTVKGDSNLIAGNIKSGVSIFGVNGNYVGSGGDTSVEDSLITGTISTYSNDRISAIASYAFNRCSRLTTVSFPACTSIGDYAFSSCNRLTTISFPACKSIGEYAFYNCFSLTTASFPACTSIGGYQTFNGCSRLTTVSFPACKSIGRYTFSGCTSLTTVSFPACTNIGSGAFSNCTSLTTVSFPACTNIENYAFQNCFNLKSLYLTGSSVCKLSASYVFSSTPIGGYSTSAGTYGSIYVPASRLTSYKTATNWVYFSSRFVGI